MKQLKFEYIWLDGYTPEPNFRSKTKVIPMDNYNGELEPLPTWSFDGSSTLQAEGNASDCLLKPVRVYPDSSRKHAYLVLCEVLNSDGTLHKSNTRHLFDDDEELWLGFEQEYVLSENGKPCGFPNNGFPEPQGKYYCGVGAEKVAGRQFVEDHMDQCLENGINITGVNAEVMIGQWEFQVFGKGAKKVADDLLMARYLLERTSEKYDCVVELHPKPVTGDWNGSGLHTNFSTAVMRNIGGEALMTSICKAFAKRHADHIAAYGSNNDKRLTGLHETQNIEKFSFGVSDRGASIRIPVSVPADNWRGYLEDRRPASNADPYKVVAEIIKTLKSAKTGQKLESVIKQRIKQQVKNSKVSVV